MKNLMEKLRDPNILFIMGAVVVGIIIFVFVMNMGGGGGDHGHAH